MPDLKFHEAANIFPLMFDAEFDALKEDIKQQGVQLPIEILDGKIIDGRNRYRACLEMSVKCPSREVEADDPVAYVLSRNLHRRHLTASQKSMIAAKAKELYEENAKKRMMAGKKIDPRVKLPEGEKGRSRDQAAKAVGVSGSLVDRGAKVLENGAPELAKAVEEGLMSVTAAAELADEPKEAQVAAANDAKFFGGRYRKTAKKVADDDNVAVVGYEKTAQFAMECARCAITQIERIPTKNPGRDEAFTKVEKWITKARGEIGFRK